MSNPECKEFNEVTVTIQTSIKSYVISNINQNGLPSDNCECHLQSLTIEDAAVGGSNNPYDIGSKGSITIIDYKDAVFKLLANHLKQFLDYNQEKGGDTIVGEPSQRELCPKVSVSIKCFSNQKVYQGYIVDWDLSFTGTTPTITLSWTTVAPPDSPSKNSNSKLLDGTSRFTYPYEMIKALKELFPNDSKNYMLKFGTTDNDVTWTKIRFLAYPDGDTRTNEEIQNGKICGIIFSPQKNIPCNYISYCQYICSLCCYINDGAQFPIYCTAQTNPDCSSGYLILNTINPSTDTGDQTNKELVHDYIFVFNGSQPAYSTISIDDKARTVIPMTSFNFKTDYKSLTLQKNVMNTVNAGNNNNSNPQSANGENKAESANPKNDAVTVSFECYNVMPFECNALDAQIKILIFNEFGNEHPVSGDMTVRKCSYSLSGGVIKANIECTSVFNNLISRQTSGPAVPSTGSSDNADFGVEDESTQSSHAGGTISLASTISSNQTTTNSSSNQSTNNSISNTNSSQTQQSVQNTADNSSKTGVEYLRSEDVYITPLSADKTLKLMSNGTFGAHVDTFLKKYGSLTGQSRLLDFSFVKELISAGNFGLLALLIAVANYGIKDPPSNWQTDAVKRMPEYSKLKNYAASATGKGPYDYKSGGLGIAHWDSGNLDDIYTTIGFPKNMSQSDQNHFSKLLVTSGSVSWKCGSFRGEERIMPVFSKGSKMTLFDKGLKQDNKWKEWAHDILYYKNSSGQAIYQYYLFELWVKKFWKLTLDKLKNKSHACIQDAVRISRAGNSATSMIGKSCGKDVSGQFDVYSYAGREVRYNRQKAYCRRCADIIGWEA